MRQIKASFWSRGEKLLPLFLALIIAPILLAQEDALNQKKVLSRDTITETTSQVETQPEPRLHKGLPEAAYAVAPGTHFLVGLGEDLNTHDLHQNQKFHVITLEPLEASHGIRVPSGAEIRGHISRVESAGGAGRARIWLTFDEIRTKFGKFPIVAEIISVPGDHSLRAGPVTEGVLEGRKGDQKSAAEAAAEGAARGAIPGVRDKNKKEAAEGAALGALEAYLMETGRGQEIHLPRGAKLELELERALYLLKE